MIQQREILGEQRNLMVSVLLRIGTNVVTSSQNPGQNVFCY